MNTNNPTQNDEIDILELILVLWKNKFKILFCAFLFAAVGVGATYLQKGKWTSKAELSQVKSLDITDYITINKEMANVMDRNFSPAALSQRLFNDFIEKASALDVRRNFLVGTELYKELITDLTEEKKYSILNKIVNDGIEVTLPVEDEKKKQEDKKVNKAQLNIKFTASKPSDAQVTLQAYIDYINNLVISEYVQYFKLDLDEILNDLQFAKTKYEFELGNKKNVQLHNLELAYKMAKQAGIKTYTKELSNNISIPEFAAGDLKISPKESDLYDSKYLFMQGEEYLKAQLDMLKQEEIIYPPAYYTISEQLRQLKPIQNKLANVVKVKSYHYLASPNYPTIKDGISRIKILALAFVLGLIFSCIAVLLRQSFKQRG